MYMYILPGSDFQKSFSHPLLIIIVLANVPVYVYICNTIFTLVFSGEGLPASVTVMTLCSAPQSVENFILSANSSSLLTYSWSRPTVPNGNIDNYDVSIIIYAHSCA